MQYYNITAKKNSKEYHDYIIELNKKKDADAKNFKEKLTDKIFDIIERDEKTYYLDKEFNLIWDEYTNVVGTINNNKLIFWKKDYEIINDMKINNSEVKKIMKNMSYLLNNKFT